ncbi:glycosyltransferase 87 family protein [Saccharothrix violaceirubra]|uniref:Alpha-1,2-mannosyltransferase n=1 Tax=Saccharothrix violaceirubra TaxID=413306 RepID=A0A7W7T786_9PSEU|nr:glycosyltransferase 87 family protein [Saccharothrix violaceirubra]MBB4966540.1 alpha-1,2-mannosyltransferase [Saccharothrix violaceirubra]
MIVPVRPIVVAGLGAVVAAAFACWLLDLPLGTDSAVYRSGALAVLDGVPLYGHLPATPSWSPDLPFAYPPVAALLFLPLAAVPTEFAWAGMAGLSVVCVGVVARLLPHGKRWWPLLPVMLEPVWRTVALGQVNLVLMTLVLVDVLRRSRWSGVLIGLAAAVKLTPLIFVGYLLIAGRRRDAARAVATFGVATGLGFLLLPGDSVRYWTSALLGANDAMSNAWWGNQSLNGVVLRLGGGTAVLAVLTLVCLGVAVYLTRKLVHDRPVEALLVMAFCGLLVSPISWSHHWVWVLPLGMLVARRPWWVVAVFSGAVLAVPLADNGYVLATLVAGVVLTVRVVRQSRRPIAALS